MYSSQTLVSDGTVNRVDLSIEYLSKTDIQVYVDDALLPANGYAWTWASDTAINFNQVVRLGSVINIRRSTAYDTIKHIFEVGGAIFKDRNVDENFRQVLYWCQDFIEGKSIKDVWNDFNMHGYRILNLGNAVDPYDAVSLGQYQADTMSAWSAKHQATQAKEAAVLAANSSADSAQKAKTAAESVGLTTPKPINSANSAVLTGHYFTSGDTPTADMYAVIVTRGKKADVDWIWQTAAKDGTIFTRDSALADLSVTAWSGTKDNQITVSDGRTQRQFNQYLDVRKAGSFYDVRDFGVLATEGVMAMTAA